MKAVIFEVPALDYDAFMLKKYQHQVSPNGRLERRIVWNLLKHLEDGGWTVFEVDDTDEVTQVTGSKHAMELIFDLDQADISVGNADRSRTHLIRLIMGNGIDIISDYTYSEGDRDGFEALMQDFNAEACA